MGVVNKFTRWAWLMSSLDSLRVRFLGELTFETIQILVSITQLCIELLIMIKISLNFLCNISITVAISKKVYQILKCHN